MASTGSDIDSDTVAIDRDDISNYNPDHILPQSPEVIASIRQWLQPTAYKDAFGEYRKHLASHAAGTGVWLTLSATYGEWLQNEKVGTLWIKGIPGSGKSVIAAQLINDLTAKYPGTPVLYFFFRQIIDANHRPTALLCDWLDQVLIYSPPLQTQLKTYLETRRPLTSLSMDDLWRSLRLALVNLPNGVYCVADALDEMDQGHEDFLRSLAALGQWMPNKIKVLMTSRPVSSVETPLRKAETFQIRLDEANVDRDIASFVQQQLNSTSLSVSDRDLISNEIPGRANGLFLYARLAMDAFLEPSADIHDVLKRLPRDLNDMYTNLLKEHSLRSGVPHDIQRIILQCATHATRPLRLLEVADMLETTYIKRTEKDLKATKNLVKAACGPLLEVLLDETICVIHHSLTEYLRGSTRPDALLGYPVLKPGPTHESLALACLTYMGASSLSKIEVKKKALTNDYDRVDFYFNKEVRHEEIQLRLKHPFLEYAVANWHAHCCKSAIAGHNQEEINKALRRFFNDGKQLQAWLSLRWPGGERYLHDVTQLHVAARLGLEAYVRELLQTESLDTDSQDAIGRTPLWWAASSGHAGVVSLLANAGANPDHGETKRGLKPLHEASSKNYAEVVRVLLQIGVSPTTGKTKNDPGSWCGNAPSSHGQTPLMYACESGHIEAVDVFLSFLSDPDTVHQALAWAAGRGRSAIVQRILQHPKADVNAKVKGDTPLFLACGAHRKETVSILLQAGADPNILCADHGSEFGRRIYLGAQSPGHSPLYRLCHSQYSNCDDLAAVFSALVEAGANLRQRDADGSNALHWAVNSLILVRLLLDAGVDANVESSDGLTPLHKAQNADVVCVLIEIGKAGVNKKDKNGRTPLLHLMDSCMPGTKDEALTKLLEFMPDCSIVDNKGNAALHHFVMRGGFGSDNAATILPKLLALGASPNCRNYLGDLPLHLMECSHNHTDQTLDLLIAAGADINARDKQGASILFRQASRTSYKHDNAFLSSLIEKGADLRLCDLKGRTMLHEAIRALADIGKDGNRLDFLLAQGLDPAAVDIQGNSLLHELAMRSDIHEYYQAEARVDLLTRLLSLGLDISQTNHAGRTALHILCSTKSSSTTFKPSTVLPIDFVISRMTTSGAGTVDVADYAGITPLHLAVTISPHSTKRLLGAGADPRRATVEGRTPLHIAAQSRASNTVGILLDALHRQQMSESLYAGSQYNGSVTVLPRGSWYCGNQFNVPAGVNALDNLKWTPLSYACRSGIPETVELLLQAGADVHLGSLVEACSQFEHEQSLWEGRRNGPDGLDNGVTLGDTSRPSAPVATSRYDTEFTLNQTARIDEILELLVKNGVSIETSDRPFWASPLDVAYKNCRDYTLGCLARAQALQIGNGEAADQGSGTDTYAIHQFRYGSEAALQSLNKFKGFKKGEANQELFMLLMTRRDYTLVRALCQAGADFFQQGLPHQNNNFGVLVRSGFASLAKAIVHDIYADSKLSHKHGGQQSPQMGDPRPNIIFRGYDPRDGADSTSYLLMAVRQVSSNMGVIRLLVEGCKVNINELHKNERTKEGSKYLVMDSPLLSVAQGQQWWHAALALPYFIERSADLNIRNYKGQTPLHIALSEEGGGRGAFRNDVVRALVRAGADVNALDAKGLSCLSYAGTDPELIKLLIENGALVDAHALFSAIDGNNYEVLVTLLSAGMNPNMRRTGVSTETSYRGPLQQMHRHADQRQIFPVHHAARIGGSGWLGAPVKDKAAVKVIRTKMVETLLAYGANPLATFLRGYVHGQDSEDEPEEPHSGADNAEIPKGYDQATILHDLVENSQLVEPFLELSDLEVDNRDGRGQTLLLALCGSRDGPDTVIENPASQSILRHLLSRGANPYARDNQGRNALHMMLKHAEQGQSSHPKFQNSLSHMATAYPTLANQKDKSGNTPLHLALLFAALEYDVEPARILLGAGADPHLTDDEGNSSLHKLAHHPFGPDNRILFEDLVKRGCDVNAPNHRGETPLFSFYSPDNLDSWDYDDSDSESEHDAGETALWEALGANFHAIDAVGRGLLHVAAKGHTLRFQELLEKGLDPMLEDEDQQTPLDVAAACGNRDILALFERKGK
ncbi:hypothetical protein E0Z10_g425 [Xylaria hypoxylon]|uniref:Nephrocystin 3-like N-terminal domain-containing protein n=1 Tax=Xylaria hypoxylon TaxID=37992 RepID=A0A4Z0YWI6_9PEZI|nr:hypothetical protein E0Z10_g425 [Xylaria hypoxylon]